MWILNNLDKVVKSAETLMKHFSAWVNGTFTVHALKNEYFLKAVDDLGNEVLGLITSAVLKKTVEGDAWNYSTQIQSVAYAIVHVLKKGAQSAFIQNCLDEGCTAVQAARLAVAHWVEEALAYGVATYTQGDTALIDIVLTASEKRQLQLMYCLDKHTSVARKYYPVQVGDDGLYVSNNPKLEKVKISDTDDGFKPFTGDCRGSKVQGETTYGFIRLPHAMLMDIVSAKVDKIKAQIARANKNLQQVVICGDPEDAEIASDQLALNAKFLASVPDMGDFLLELLTILPDCELEASCNLVDARLRNIIGDSMKPISWVSWKELRAMVRMLGKDVKKLNLAGKLAIYAYVAELFGMKSGNIAIIRAHGKCLVESFFNDPSRAFRMTDLEMHERILLYRIVLCLRDNLPCDFWIEVDQTSEVLATTSTLLGWTAGMVRTNVAPDVVGYKRDGWSVKTLARSFIKLIATPILYGASQTWKKLVNRACKKLGWNKSAKELQQLELDSKHCFDIKGDFGVIAAWADWLTSMMETRNNPEHGYDVHYDGYDLHYDHMKSYDRYEDTGSGTRQDNSVLIESHDLKVVPDTKRPERKIITCVNRKVFRGWRINPKGMTRYWPTALVHSMGAQVTQYVMVELHRHGAWFLCIHDAYLVHPNEGHIVTKAVARAYTEMYAHRKDIVGAFLGSFGLSWDSFLVWVPQAIRAQLAGPEIPTTRLESGYNAFI